MKCTPVFSKSLINRRHLSSTRYILSSIVYATKIQANKYDIIKLKIDAVSTYFVNNCANELRALIQQIQQSLAYFGSAESAIEPEAKKQKPIVPIKTSVTPDHVIMPLLSRMTNSQACYHRSI